MTARHTDNLRSRHPRQRLLLAVAVGLLAIAAVLVLVVVLRDRSDGPQPGSPDAVTDQLASALTAHSRKQVAALACAGAGRAVLSQARSVLRSNRSARRVGTAEVNGAVAVGRIELDVASAGAPGSASAAPAVSATVALQKNGDTWCVAAFAAALPR